jgi:hypothetical protein
MYYITFWRSMSTIYLLRCAAQCRLIILKQCLACFKCCREELSLELLLCSDVLFRIISSEETQSRRHRISHHDSSVAGIPVCELIFLNNKISEYKLNLVCI